MARLNSLTLNDILQQAKYAYQVPELIEQAIHRKIILKQAELAGLSIATEELQSTADQLRVKHQLLTAQDTMDWLKIHHLSIEDFEDLAYFQLMRQKLAAHLINAKIPAHFADRQLDYAQAIIYTITVPQRELAMELFYSWQSQEQDFLAILHRHMPDSQQRFQGKYRRIVRRHEIDPELSALIFAATTPTALPPFEIPKGFQLVYVAELIAPELNATVEAEIREALFQKWLRKQSRAEKMTIPDLSSQTLAKISQLLAQS